MSCMRAHIRILVSRKTLRYSRVRMLACARFANILASWCLVVQYDACTDGEIDTKLISLHKSKWRQHSVGQTGIG